MAEAPKGRGGYRANAGRKKKYDEDSRVLTMRVPESVYNDLKKALSRLAKDRNLLEMFLEATN